MTAKQITLQLMASGRRHLLTALDVEDEKETKMMRITGPALLAIAVMLAACGSDDSPAAAADDAVEVVADTAAEADADDKDEIVAEEASEEVAATADPTVNTNTEAAPAPTGGFSFNGLRYCEILMAVSADNGEQVTEVWGTPGIGPCDDIAWNALDPDAVMAENNASSILMNGPRFFTVDGTVDTAPGSVGVGTAAGGEAVLRDFGDVSMTLLATVDGSTTESAPYVPNLVVRTATWTFNAGTEVYELADPDGNVYVMQSYALYVDSSLTAEDLPTLGDQLDMPEGWSYSSRVLDRGFEVALTPDGAMVVTDELGKLLSAQWLGRARSGSRQTPRPSPNATSVTAASASVASRLVAQRQRPRRLDATGEWGPVALR